MSRLTPNEAKVLAFLSSAQDGHCYPFAPIIAGTGLERRVVRRACRSLARKGLAEFERGLWTEDGEMAGAGYGATPQGRNVAEPAP